MIKGQFGVTHGTVATSDVAKIVIDLLDGNIDQSTAYERIRVMDERIHDELEMLATIDGPHGKETVVVAEQKEWYIHNSAKAETRGAILEILLQRLQKRE